jgi:hypothetical protein
MAKPWDAEYMRDCFLDWREDIAHAREPDRTNELVWVQAWLLEQLLNRIEELSDSGDGKHD